MRHIGRVLLLMLFCTPSVFGQNEIALIGGTSLSGDTRSAAGVTFSRGLGGGWAAEVGLFQTEETFNVYPLNRFPHAVFAPIPPEQRTGDILSVTAAMHYQWNREGRWQPYLGGGFLYASVPDDIAVDLLDPEDSSTTMFLSGGITYVVNEGLGIRLDVRDGRWGWEGPRIMGNGVAAVGARWRF